MAAPTLDIPWARRKVLTLLRCKSSATRKEMLMGHSSPEDRELVVRVLQTLLHERVVEIVPGRAKGSLRYRLIQVSQ